MHGHEYMGKGVLQSVLNSAVSILVCITSVFMHLYVGGGNKIGVKDNYLAISQVFKPRCMWTFSPQFGVTFTRTTERSHRESGYICLPANPTLMLWCSQGLRGSHEITEMCWTSFFEIFRPLSVCHCMKSESEKGIHSVKKAAFHTLVTSVYCHYGDNIVVSILN